jgi:hypothetical protein
MALNRDLRKGSQCSQYLGTMELRHVMAIWASCMALLSSAQSAVVPLGGDATGPGGSVSFTLGQLADEHPASAAGNVQEGVQQPYVDGSTLITERRGIIDVNVSPTVTADQVTVQLPNMMGHRWSVTVFDVHGCVVVQRSLKDTRTDLSLAHLASGVYQMLIQEDVRAVRTFTIIRTDQP